MKPELILHADLLDIVFENRNKEYGAYVLRKQYPAVLQRALLLVMLSVAATSFLFFYLRNPNQSVDSREILIPGNDTVVLAPPPPATPEVPPPPPQPLASIEHRGFDIDNDGQDTIPTIEALDQPVQIGTSTRLGDSSDLVGPIAPVVEATGEMTAPAAEPTPSIYRSVQEMPEFPGGVAALRRFLLKHLRVPEDGLESGIRISVEVQFIVGANGNITGMEIIKSGGDDYNREVLRVLNKMPVWKPGRQNGIQVPVYFKLPVTFQTE